MKLNAILMLLACIALANSSAIDESEETGTVKRIRSILGDMKNTIRELNNRPSTQTICVWKICSKRVVRPVIADHFRAAKKATSKWWHGLFKNKQTRPNSSHGRAFRITDLLIKSS